MIWTREHSPARPLTMVTTGPGDLVLGPIFEPPGAVEQQAWDYFLAGAKIQGMGVVEVHDADLRCRMAIAFKRQR